MRQQSLHKKKARQPEQSAIQQSHHEAVPHEEKHPDEHYSLTAPGFGHNFSQISVLPPSTTLIQPKLTVNTPGDQFEQEADRVAEEVMRLEAPGTQPVASAHSEEHIDRKATAPNIPDLSPSLHASIDSMRGGGQPLDDSTRAFMEPRFGHDFSQVRVHADTHAADMAYSVNALAFTIGHDIAFAAGQYQPNNGVGRRLLAHELTHVMQQRSASVQPGGGVSRAGDRYGQQADGVANTIAKGRSSESARDRHTSSEAAISSQVQIQRKPAPSGGTGVPYVGSCKLKTGTMQWSLVPMVGYVNARIEFIPTPAVAAASKTISFIQTVSDTVTTEGLLGTGLFSSSATSSTQVDAEQSDNDPFYGAKWNPAAGQWGDEPNATQARPGDYQGQAGSREGSRPFTAATGSAVLNDSPMLQIRQSKQFETVAVVVETGQVLASLNWNIQRWVAGLVNESSSTIVRWANCAEGASADFPAVVEQFYRDNAVVDGFAPGKAELPAAHKQQLAPVVAKLLKETGRRVIVGGAATQDEANPAVLSRERAERVRTYLVGEGIAESRIDIEAYGSDWARSPVARPDSEQSNRRVQVKIS